MKNFVPKDFRGDYCQRCNFINPLIDVWLFKSKLSYQALMNVQNELQTSWFMQRDLFRYCIFQDLLKICGVPFMGHQWVHEHLNFIPCQLDKNVKISASDDLILPDKIQIG